MSEMKDLTDEQLVKIIREKDKQLYREIIKRYQKKLLRYANYIVQDEEKAADVVQSSFIKAYINLHGFNIKKKFSSWIYRIVHNEALNMLRREKRLVRIEENVDYSLEGEGIDDNLIKKELKEKLSDCLKELPIIYREPLVLYYLEDKSYDQISDILHIPVNTVATRLYRAKSLLKKICQRKKINL